MQGLCGNRDDFNTQEFLLPGGFSTKSVDIFGEIYGISTGGCNLRSAPSPLNDTCIPGMQVSDFNFDISGVSWE